MVRRRNTFLLVLALVSVGILYVTLVLKKVEFVNLYPQFNVSNDVEIREALHAPPPLIALATADSNCSNGTLMYGMYCVISPYKNEMKNTSSVGVVTLCTQGTIEFLQHIVVLCHRWSAPVSVAVYSPLDDYADARIMVHMLRQCDSCVRYWVNWHFFLPKETEVPDVYPFLQPLDCSSVVKVKSTRKRKSEGIYPINVGRNIARRMANTPFIFSIDIELYPSLNIPAKFERMLRSQVQGPDNQVWVLPVFEVHSVVRAPLVKSQLRSLYTKKLAISFHQYRCNICHRIPNLTQWMTHGEGRIVSEVQESLEPLRVWTTVKRSRRYKLQEWEPFFIGTTKDPEFDIRLSWEGKQNKMQMAFEMCMRNYDFHIIENAFLVHTPGINVYNASKEKTREKYLSKNRKVISMVKKALIQKYRTKNDCL